MVKRQNSYHSLLSIRCKLRIEIHQRITGDGVSKETGLTAKRPRYRAMKRGQLKIPIAATIKIKNARVARLATVDQQGHPHVVPICFAYGGGVFYTAVDLKTKRVPLKDLARVRNIRTTPQVALVLDEYREDWDRLWYVLVRGKARLIPESARKERAKAIRQLRAKYAQYAAGMLPDNVPIIRITPERIAVWGRLLDTAAR